MLVKTVVVFVQWSASQKDELREHECDLKSAESVG